MNMKVVKHSADEEKDEYKVILKGASDLVPGCLVEAEPQSQPPNVLPGIWSSILFEFHHWRNCTEIMDDDVLPGILLLNDAFDQSFPLSLFILFRFPVHHSSSHSSFSQEHP